MGIAGHQLRRWTRQEYEQMIAAGVIRSGERVELLNGEIRTMAAQGSAHVTTVQALLVALAAAFGPAYNVRSQAPLALGERSEPEPDLAVVPGTIWDYEQHHPSQALLVVEVADSTLKTDRLEKGSLYASAGIQEFWLVNLVDRVLEVYRDPFEDSKAKHGWRYRLIQRFSPAEQVSPLARPESSIPVASFLRPHQR